MRNRIIFTLILIAAIGISSTVTSYVVSTNTAEVEKQDEIMLFIRCRPVSDYEVLGTVNTPGVMNSVKAGPVIDVMVKRCRKNYPSADGLIFTDDKLFEGKAIKFK